MKATTRPPPTAPSVPLMEISPPLPPHSSSTASPQKVRPEPGVGSGWGKKPRGGEGLGPQQPSLTGVVSGKRNGPTFTEEGAWGEAEPGAGPCQDGGMDSLWQGEDRRPSPGPGMSYDPPQVILIAILTESGRS